ncbi:LysR family transcriptional regulator [Maribrevibacterium harenarium]|uniref:LysR family transcriptional regulator n=2 Tax=Maribrevibacterium harenarium TaxID=2589817 RepID=A0A501WLS5_9GAMM|nr:LysR family transcriptional regulator [Maribrevibacterium harenarium]
MCADAGSFSQAALRLGVTQPTLSRQIYALEQHLGVTLFERLSTGLVLTASGEHLLRFARPMSANAEQVALAIAGLTTATESPVTLSVSEIDALFRLPDLLVHLRQVLPHVQIDVQVSNQVSDLKRRESDIALRSFRPQEPDLITRKIADEPIWFYGTKELVESYGLPARPDQVGAVEIIGFERGGRLIEQLAVQGWQLTQQNFPIVTLFQGLQWQLVKRGAGLGFFPEKIGEQTGLVKAFEHFGPPMTIPLWLVTHRELHTNPRLRQVFDVIAKWLLEH